MVRNEDLDEITSENVLEGSGAQSNKKDEKVILAFREEIAQAMQEDY